MVLQFASNWNKINNDQFKKMDGLVKIPLMFEHVINDVTHSNIVYVLTYSNAQDFLVLIMHFFITASAGNNTHSTLVLA